MAGGFWLAAWSLGTERSGMLKRKWRVAFGTGLVVLLAGLGVVLWLRARAGAEKQSLVTLEKVDVSAKQFTYKHQMLGRYARFFAPILPDFVLSRLSRNSGGSF
jgi:hypothetical protein